MSIDSAAVRGRRCFGASSSKLHLQIASLCRRRPGILIGSPTARYKLGRSVFVMPFSIYMLLKAAQGREAGQGRKKTLKIHKHDKNT
jgi:hypothetical protein